MIDHGLSHMNLGISHVRDMHTQVLGVLKQQVGQRKMEPPRVVLRAYGLIPSMLPCQIKAVGTVMFLFVSLITHENYHT